VASYERSAHLSLSPDDVFLFLADVRNLPGFPGALLTDVWLRVDERDRRIEWGGTEAPGVRGAIAITEEAVGTRLTIELHTPDAADEGVTKDLERALERLACAAEERGSALH
jgi:hypothetical protein